MDSLKISQVAQQTGLSPATLRYYDELGLVRPSARSDSGYRLYSDDDLARLHFVLGAKRFGLSLQEIGELVELRDNERCEPVQLRMRELVHDRLMQTKDDLQELMGFAAELQQLAAQLDGPPSTGPCDDTCLCSAESTGSVSGAPIELVQATTIGTSDPAIACTLAADGIAERADTWSALLDRAGARRSVDGGIALEFPAEPELAARLAETALLEQACCGFFDFRISMTNGSLELEVRAPAAAAEVTAALFGVAS